MAAQCLFVNHPELYFEDGNIVLSASCTLDKEKWGNNNLLSSLARGGLSAADADHLGFRFRVHKSILAMHSTVLKDMLLLPQGEDRHIEESDIKEVDMPDSAEQIEAMLDMMYGKGMFKWYRY